MDHAQPSPRGIQTPGTGFGHSSLSFLLAANTNRQPNSSLRPMRRKECSGRVGWKVPSAPAFLASPFGGNVLLDSIPPQVSLLPSRVLTQGTRLIPEYKRHLGTSQRNGYAKTIGKLRQLSIFRNFRSQVGPFQFFQASKHERKIFVFPKFRLLYGPGQGGGPGGDTPAKRRSRRRRERAAPTAVLRGT